MLVSCGDCAFFLRDRIGSGQGIGHCRQYDDYIAKGPSEQGRRDALRKLGNNPDYDGDLFWNGGVKNRKCEKYEPKTIE